jgi:hypothetical protein
MVDQPESPVPNPNLTPPTPPTGKNGKVAKSKNSPKPEYGAMRFRLPKALERAVRFASFELEENPKAIHKTPQAILEQGTRRYLDLLSTNKHVNFPPGMLPPKSTQE